MGDGEQPVRPAEDLKIWSGRLAERSGAPGGRALPRVFNSALDVESWTFNLSAINR